MEVYQSSNHYLTKLNVQKDKSGSNPHKELVYYWQN